MSVESYIIVLEFLFEHAPISLENIKLKSKKFTENYLKDNINTTKKI
jgi:hypothetical protein